MKYLAISVLFLFIVATPTAYGWDWPFSAPKHKPAVQLFVDDCVFSKGMCNCIADYLDIVDDQFSKDAMAAQAWLTAKDPDDSRSLLDAYGVLGHTSEIHIELSKITGWCAHQYPFE